MGNSVKAEHHLVLGPLNTFEPLLFVSTVLMHGTISTGAMRASAVRPFGSATFRAIGSGTLRSISATATFTFTSAAFSTATATATAVRAALSIELIVVGFGFR